MTMTRMIAKAAGDNESQESILDDSLCGSRSNRTDTTTNTAQTKSSMEVEPTDSPEKKLGRFNSNRRRFSQTVGGLTRSTEASPTNEGGISCTTEIVVQYSTEEESNEKALGKKPKLGWA